MDILIQEITAYIKILRQKEYYPKFNTSFTSPIKDGLNKALIDLYNDLKQKINNDRLVLRKDLLPPIYLHKYDSEVIFRTCIKITDKYMLDLLNFKRKKLTKINEYFLVYLCKHKTRSEAYKNNDIFIGCYFTTTYGWEINIDFPFTYDNYNKMANINILEYEDKLIKICINRKNRFALPMQQNYIDCEFIYS